MPEKTWSAKRERQYKHIKEGLRTHGKSEKLSEEIAARTVNKERARCAIAVRRAGGRGTLAGRECRCFARWPRSGLNLRAPEHAPSLG